MTASYVIALDQGTTSSRCVLIDKKGQVCDIKQHPFKQYYPRPGWVEHDPTEIASTQLGTLMELISAHNLHASEVAGIGITNQRETTVIWDRTTGAPIYNAIVWQCRRTSDEVARLTADPAIRERIIQTTGLIPDAYFSASKIAWILDNVPHAREKAEAGELAFGTVDTWLIWNLTEGKVHATDATNASRTMLFDIHKGAWDPWLLELFNIPASVLPEVLPSASFFGTVTRPCDLGGVPLSGIAGDQQAALFGQCCFNPGEAKNTYGTGCFLLMNTGHRAPRSVNGLVTTIAASAPDSCTTNSRAVIDSTRPINTLKPEQLEYALEGSVFVSGALIQWLRDELGLIESASETEALAESVEDTAGVHIVPAFTGLGAPYWCSDARGVIFGLTRGTNKAHLVRAALEAQAFQMNDLLKAMEADADTPISSLNVDGGASANNFLMQFQTDITGVPIRRPQNTETTALGAAYLAGLTVGFWTSLEEIKELRSKDTLFDPHMIPEKRAELIKGWKQAVESTLSHADR